MDMNKKSNRKRRMVVWLGSYLIAAIVLFFYFNAPLFPIILGGFAALAITLRFNI